MAEQPLMVCDERFRRDKERLNDHNATIKQLSDVSLKLSLLVEQHEKKLSQNDERLDILEQKPAKRWDSAVGNIISIILALCIGFIAAKIGLS